jgi:hypothetical protein
VVVVMIKRARREGDEIVILVTAEEEWRKRRNVNDLKRTTTNVPISQLIMRLPNTWAITAMLTGSGGTGGIMGAVLSFIH